MSKETNLAQKALYFSLNHHLERKSVATEKEILATALNPMAASTTIEAVKNALETAKQEGIVLAYSEKGKTYLTTKIVLLEEQKLLSLAAEFKDKFEPINPHYQSPNALLSVEQRQAITNVLSSRHGISIIAGKAGTGKTYLMKEIQEGLLAVGKNILAFAPTPEAAEVQRQDGFGNAKTIAELLSNTAIQNQTKEAVLWIDEAGMVCNKDMNGMLDIAKSQNARLVLTGDTRQHASVKRGDALRILQQKSGYKISPLSKIHRQKNEDYRQAVRLISDGAVQQGFDKLNELGFINQIEDKTAKIEAITADYLQFISLFNKKSGKVRSKSILIICLNYHEGNEITKKIREKLQEAKILSDNEKVLTHFKNLALTQAQKMDISTYQMGLYLIFQHNTRSIKAGEKLEIIGTNDKNEVLVKTPLNEPRTVALSDAKNLKLFEAQPIHLAVGDKIRLTRNGKLISGKNVFNGNVYTVKDFDENGNIQLANGYTLPKDFGHFTHGYVLTSFAAQGKSVDKVIIVYNSFPFNFALMEQFYVAVSRGKESITIYTNDKAELMKAVSLSAARHSAISMVEKR